MLTSVLVGGHFIGVLNSLMDHLDGLWRKNTVGLIDEQLNVRPGESVVQSGHLLAEKSPRPIKLDIYVRQRLEQPRVSSTSYREIDDVSDSCEAAGRRAQDYCGSFKLSERRRAHVSGEENSSLIRL